MLASAFLAGPQTARAAADRAAHLLGKRWSWATRLARRYVEQFPGVPRQVQVRQFIESDAGFRRAVRKHQLVARQVVFPAPLMRPVPVARSWKVPTIVTPGELADWLGLDPADLAWLADLRGYPARSENLRHYTYRVEEKRSGGLRLIEAPKTRLKQIQRQILTAILERFPPHPAVHGFVPGRSIVTFARPHAGQRVVLRLDLQDFFPSIRRPRVNAIFRTAGYPDAVASLLAGLVTHATPAWIWPRTEAAMAARRLYREPHLPQGAPTSPALANIAAHGLDRRLAGLARHAGVNYSRYADDLAFSGGKDFERNTRDFAALVAAIAAEEGFAVSHRKTRRMAQGTRQHLAGLTTNQHPNIARRDFDALKATLTNCVRHGAASQNRQGHADFRAHLAGKVAFMEMVNPAKAARLRQILEQIRW